MVQHFRLPPPPLYHREISNLESIFSLFCNMVATYNGAESDKQKSCASKINQSTSLQNQSEKLIPYQCILEQVASTFIALKQSGSEALSNLEILRIKEIVDYLFSQSLPLRETEKSDKLCEAITSIEFTFRKIFPSYLSRVKIIEGSEDFMLKIVNINTKERSSYTKLVESFSSDLFKIDTALFKNMSILSSGSEGSLTNNLLIPKFSNALSYFIMFIILQEGYSDQQRANSIAFFLDVLAHCLESKNHNSARTIQSALENPLITRLDRLFKLLDPKHKNLKKTLENKLSFFNSADTSSPSQIRRALSFNLNSLNSSQTQDFFSRRPSTPVTSKIESPKETSFLIPSLPKVLNYIDQITTIKDLNKDFRKNTTFIAQKSHTPVKITSNNPFFKNQSLLHYKAQLRLEYNILTTLYNFFLSFPKLKSSKPAPETHKPAPETHSLSTIFSKQRNSKEVEDALWTLSHKLKPQKK